MRKKRVIPLRFSVEIEERLWAPAARRWHAQFKFYPLGYFRGKGPCPGSALGRAWQRFEQEIHPRQRWWTVIQGPVPPIRL